MQQTPCLEEGHEHSSTSQADGSDKQQDLMPLRHVHRRGNMCYTDSYLLFFTGMLVREACLPG